MVTRDNLILKGWKFHFGKIYTSAKCFEFLPVFQIHIPKVQGPCSAGEVTFWFSWFWWWCQPSFHNAEKIAERDEMLDKRDPIIARIQNLYMRAFTPRLQLGWMPWFSGYTGPRITIAFWKWHKMYYLKDKP